MLLRLREEDDLLRGVVMKATVEEGEPGAEEKPSGGDLVGCSPPASRKNTSQAIWLLLTLIP